MHNETMNDRLKKFLKEKSISQVEFSKSIGSTQQYVSAILNNKRNIGTKLFNIIINKYPLIDDYWLLKGEESTISIKEETKNNLLEEKEYLSLQGHRDAFDLEDDISQRFQSVLDYLQINVSIFTSKLGEDRPDKYYSIINGRTKKFSPDSLAKISKFFPEIDTIWLNRGVGQMLKINIPVFDNVIFDEKLSESGEFILLKELVGSIFNRGLKNQQQIQSLIKEFKLFNSEKDGSS